MLNSSSTGVGGRLAINFANLPSLPASPGSKSLGWEDLISFLRAARIISTDRAAELMSLTEVDPQAAFGLLNRAERLRDALRLVFRELAHRQRIPGEQVRPINDVLRVTEGHDELVEADKSWRIEYVAREGGLDWLLAAVARSAALSRNRLICRHFCEGHGAPISTLGNFLQLLMWSQSGQPALLGQ